MNTATNDEDAVTVSETVRCKTAIRTVEAIREWVTHQKATPWSTGSFARNMTGEEGYDAALEEVEALLGYHAR